MSNVDAGMIDEIFTKQSSTTTGSPVVLAAADATRRPFVCFARCVGVGSTILIGTRVVHDAGDTTYAGFTVGNRGEAVTHTGSGTAYLVTCGYLRVGAGEGKSAVQSS